jgi:peptide-methionine (S)-S-oxide reductase
MEKAVFGAGCFWHVEEEFRKVNGVISTQAGYMGGTRENPSYEEVCSGTTGHAEVVEVTFDPTLVSFEKLLETFWDCHDPTQLNRQGADVGTNYRSVIFFFSQEQEKTAQGSLLKEEKSGGYSRPIVTEIKEASAFWRAEEYHQQYCLKHGLATCRLL